MTARRLLLTAAIPLAGLAAVPGALAQADLPSPDRPAPAAAVPGAPTTERAWVGRVLLRVSARAAPRTSARSRAVVSPTAPFAGGPTTLLVTRSTVVDGRRWVEVLLPERPNGTTGWLPADVLRLRTTDLRVVVDVGDRRMELLRAGRRVMTAPVAVGKPGTPTPIGRFAVAELVRTRTPGAFLGPVVFPLTGYSETLNEFAGGDGRVAMHGTSLPELIGTRASNGCIRMRNRDVVRLSRVVRPGVPVVIRR
jgi:lipoprotein-anchoring transpeptidase ErfK/SrfK